MRTKLKKILGAALVMVMLLCSVQVLAFAAKEDPSEIPIVELLGAFHALYYNAGTPQQTKAFDSTNVDSMVNSLMGDAMLEIYERNKAVSPIYALSDALAEVLEQKFGVLAFNPDGTPKERLDGNQLANEYFLGKRDTTTPPGMTRPVTMKRMYVFDFDWRQSPVDIADRLNKYIQRVKQHSGHDKVNLSLQSGSAGVGLAYLARYGTKDLHAYWSSMSLFQSTIFGETFNKRLHFDSDAIFNCTLLTTSDSEDVKKIMEVSKRLDDAGLLSLAFGGAYLVLKPTMINRIFNKVVTPVIASIPMMWSYVPPEDYAGAIKAVFGNNKKQYAGLIAKLDTYQNNVNVRAKEILADAAKKIPVGLFASYGSALLPIAQGTNVNSDTLVELKSATMGATSNPPGKKLSGTRGRPYQQKVNDGHNHLSPDGYVDASTCLLAETTWFANDATHFTIHQVSRLRNWFFDTAGATVFTRPDYPQFLRRNPEFIASKSNKNVYTTKYYADPTIAPAYLPQ